MAKDPAFLFYSNDFDAATKFFTDEQVGIYLRLMIAQHQHGHLSEKQVKHICKTHDEEVLSKFKKDENGQLFSERLDFEINRRKKFSESRSNNRKGHDTSEEHMNNISKTHENHMSPHMETETETEIRTEPEPEKKEKPKSEKSRLTSFENSKWFDRKVFDQESPEDWDQDKKDHYWSAALAYSNKGKTYKNWMWAVMDWDRPKKPKPTPTGQPLNGHQPYFEQPQHIDQINQLLYAFNEFAQTSFDVKDPNIRRPVNQRLAAGADPNDMHEIIQLKCMEFTGEKRKFLSLNSIFSDKNYASYLQEVQDIKDKKRSPNLSTQQLGKIRHERIKAALGQDF